MNVLNNILRVCRVRHPVGGHKGSNYFGWEPINGRWPRTYPQDLKPLIININIDITAKVGAGK